MKYRDNNDLSPDFDRRRKCHHGDLSPDFDRRRRCFDDDLCPDFVDWERRRCDDVIPDFVHRHRRCDKFVSINSSTGGAGPLPIITTPLTSPINVTSVTVDTRCARDHHYDNTTVKILLIFTCILNLPVGVLVVLNFQITRSNGETTIPVGPTFTFSDLISVLEGEAFSFQFFDTDLEPGNYTYSVEIEPTSIISVVPGVTITNATLSAIASAD